MKSIAWRSLIAKVLIATAVVVPSANSAVVLAATDVLPAAAIDPQKLAIAKKLTDWMQTKLLERKTLVAVVSRKGGNDARKRDRTGMAHSGLAVYDPRAQTWILYQLMNNGSNAAQPVAELWRTAPLDFFYGQTGYESNALLMIPDEETQQRIYDGIVSGKASRLMFTRNYNLLSKYDSDESLNCNKWILMTIAAARSDNYDPRQVLAIIRNGFEPGKIKLNFVEKAVAKRKPNVRSAEMPQFGAVQTVTPQSLYDSGLFQERLFAAPLTH